MKTYQVKDWDAHFENNKSREREQCSFVCVPNKQHGMGFGWIMSETDGSAIYGIWCLILGACSQQRASAKYRRDGWLTDDGRATGRPYTAADLMIKFRRPEKEIQRALDVLSSNKVGWLEVHDNNAITEQVPVQCPSSARPVPIVCPQSANQQPGTCTAGASEGKEGREKKETETESRAVKKPAFAQVNIPDSLNTPEFLEAWGRWTQHLKQKRGATLLGVEMQLKKCVGWGVSRSIVAINHSIEKMWRSIYEPYQNNGSNPARRVDGNVGTLNDGKSSQYRNVGK